MGVTSNYFGKPVSKVEHLQSGDLFGNDFNDLTDQQAITNYTYDKNGNLETVTTPTLTAADGTQYNSVVTTYTYDNLNRQISESQPGNDENGTNVTITNSVTYNWDGSKNIVTDELNHTTQHSYNKRGMLEKVTNAKGGVAAYYYDRAGRKIAEVSPQNFDPEKALSQMERTEYTYDLMGRVKTVAEKFNEKTVNPTTFQWASNWVEIVTKAYKYDAQGNAVKELDALGYEAGTGAATDDKINSGYGTEYTYNLAGKLITKLDPVAKDKALSYAYKYSYDALGRRISDINAKGAITITDYDDAGNIKAVKVKKDSGSTEQVMQSKSYDYLNRVTSQTDGMGNLITYTYNIFNKVRKAIYPGDDTIGVSTVTYQYDVLGNLKKQADTEGTVNTYNYDNQGRIVSQKVFESGKEALQQL